MKARLIIHGALLLVFLIQSSTCNGKSPPAQLPEQITANPGAPWTAASPAAFGGSNINAIAWGNNTFVAGGYNGKMAVSSDGIRWTAMPVRPFDLGNIVWGNNRFAASYLDADFKTKVAYSSNGRRWTTARTPYEFFIVSGIVWGGGLFVAAGDAVGNAADWTLDGRMIYSADGKRWTAVEDTSFGDNPIHALAWGNGTFVAAGFMGKMAYSYDGIHWNAVTEKPFGNSSIYDIAWGSTSSGGIFVAAADRGRMAYSSDGIHWQTTAGPFGNIPVRTITWGSGFFVAAGRNRIARSVDGIRWTAISETGFGSSAINAIAWGNSPSGGIFTAAGDGGRMAYSGDGIHWQSTAGPFGSIPVRTITWGGGFFVAAGRNRMARSADGIRWTAVIETGFGSSAINAIAWGNNTFVAVGDDGKVGYSR
jgi:hypothetical protein